LGAISAPIAIKDFEAHKTFRSECHSTSGRILLVGRRVCPDRDRELTGTHSVQKVKSETHEKLAEADEITLLNGMTDIPSTSMIERLL
jgi:hypothetical protein